jgi:hypothetical protein
MFSYRSIFRKALKVTWRNKYLWFFGLFASLVSFGTEYQILSRAMGEKGRPMYMYFKDAGVFSSGFWSNMAELWSSDAWALITVVLVGLACLAIMVFLAWLAVISQAAIIDSAEKIVNKRKEALSLGIASGLAVGRHKFWRVLGLDVITKVTVAILVWLVSLPLVSSISIPELSIVYVVLFVILVPVALVFSLFINYSIAFVVIKDYSVSKSLQQGWSLFKKNWLVSIEMAFMLFLVNFLLTIVIIMSATVFFLVFISVFSPVMLSLGVLALILFMVLSGCILSTFQITAWTDLFIKLRSSKVSSRLERLMPSVKSEK